MKISDAEEGRRLALLKSFHILDTPAEAVFDRLTELAAHVCQTPMAVMTLVDEKRQWFKSTYGMDIRETERSISFCTHTIERKDAFVVPDAGSDPRFSSNPLVTREPNLAFYAGVPLLTEDAKALGTVAVLDRVPRQLSPLQMNALKILAEQIMAQLELRRRQIETAMLTTQRDRLRTHLQHREEHLRQAQHIAQIGSWELDGTRPRYSAQMKHILGVPPEGEITQEMFAAAVVDADRERWQQAHALLREQKTPMQIEYRLRRRDGSVRYVLERAEWRGNGFSAPAGTVQDVTQQHHANEQLKLLESSIARISDVVMITDACEIDEPGPHIVFVNDAFERGTGYTRAEVIGHSPRFLQGEKTPPDELDRIRTALKRREPVSAELLNYKKSGEPFWVEIDIRPILDESGRVSHFVSIQRDITEHKRRSIKLGYAIRAMQMLSQANTVLMKLEDEQELLKKVCEAAVETGGYRMAWIGYAASDEAHSIVPMAYAGASAAAEIADLVRAGISYDENRPGGRGPSGKAIRSGKPVVCENLQADPALGLGNEIAFRHGAHGVVCLPLRERERTFGVFMMLTNEVRAIDGEELLLLQELGDNMAFRIGHLQALQKRRRTEEAVVKVAASVSAASGKAFFEQLLRNMVEAVGGCAGFLCRFTRPERMRVLVAQVVGKTQGMALNPADEIPAIMAQDASDWVVTEGLASRFPQVTELLGQQAQACVGQRLDSSGGAPLGTLFILFSSPLEETGLIISTLRIFATRAAAELEREDADARIREQASLLDKAKDAIIVASVEGRITYWNKGAERLYGYSAEEAHGRFKPRLIMREERQFGHATAAAVRFGDWSGEMNTRRKDGRELVVDSHWTLVRDSEGKPKEIFAIDTDITRRKHDEREIEHLAFFDPLTQLPNRRLLLDRLHHALATAGRMEVTGALLFIDLDNFKSLNDTLGHQTGDLLLQQVARRLEACVPRKSDTVARFGGDEFVVLLEELSRHSREAAGQAERVAEKILHAFRHAFQLDAQEYHATPSIGVALFDRDHGDLGDILKRADLAMYQSKGAGRNTVRFFDPEMQTVVSARVALEADLRRSLKRHEFTLFYQAQTDQHGKMIGMEALLRWLHPQRGMVLPAQFIPFAEESGLILRLGRWVLEQACTQLAQWALNPATSHLTLAVNVSARQFRHPHFVSQVLSILRSTGAPAKNLKLELTESLLLTNLEETIAKMATLKQAGVGFSLDDFGTGYSSLSYLKRLPLDQLKIDQSFVRDVLTDTNDAVIAKTIVALAQNLGLSVIAEGVETAGQRDFLAQNGCLAYQGYLFGEPVPAEQIA